MHDLPLELLRTFVATVETGSMAAAARVVARTPSAVSLQMSKLGELVGHPLFRRDGRTQALTRAGELLVPHAREILNASERAIAALADERLEGPVRLGTVQDLADGVLPRALSDFAQQYPGVTLEVKVAQSASLLEQAMSGQLDFVICFRGGRATRVIRREPMVWLGHRELRNRRANRRKLRHGSHLQVVREPDAGDEGAREQLGRCREVIEKLVRRPPHEVLAEVRHFGVLVDE